MNSGEHEFSKTVGGLSGTGRSTAIGTLTSPGKNQTSLSSDSNAVGAKLNTLAVPSPVPSALFVLLLQIAVVLVPHDWAELRSAASVRRRCWEKW